MKPEKKYHGVIVPMITPLKQDNTIDGESVGRIVGLLKNAGVYPFILGTTGEAPSISDEQKDRMVAETVKYVGADCLVYAGISSNCFDESVTMAHKYHAMGVDVVVATLPAYYPMNNQQMVSYFTDLADQMPCPLIIYNMPATVKISIPLAVLDQLSKHPNIVGTKDSERDMERLDRSIELWKDRPDFVHLLGWAAQSAYALKKGSDGIVPSTGNFVPELYEDLYQSTLEGKFERAEDLQQQTNDLSLLYQKDRILSQSIPALKSILAVMGICGTQVLPPMYRLHDEAVFQNNIKEELQKLEIIQLNE